MIDNNLDFEVALYPYELVTYGETGQVCQNWMQYRLIKRYLEVLTREQTLVVASGHPVGLFASSPEAPRVIITNALMVGCFDDQENWHRADGARGGQLRADDRRRLDVHRAAGHRARHLQHPPERRPGQARHPAGPGPGRPAVRDARAWAA